MQFRTQIPILNSDHPIDYDSKVVALGSCFAENMVEKLDYFGFPNVLNPFGILFHPIAIQKFLEYAVKGHDFSEAAIFFHNERWHCFDAHSVLSNSNKEQLVNTLNTRIVETRSALCSATHILLTYGTAWVYQDISSGKLVANCHKIPQKNFIKRLLSVKEIEKSISAVVSMLKLLNPKLTILTTISPVRHIKDGFIENQQSKAHLITALHRVLATNRAVYFPSYEIMMDELRDYRFYADDMLHPNPMAINYIWERFSSAFITKDAADTMQEIDSIRKALAHKPFNPDSDSHRSFQLKLQQRILKLREKHPQLVF